MKLGIFTDSHYSTHEVTCGKRYNNKSLMKIRKAFERFVKEKCDYVICLGDLTDKENNHPQEIINLQEAAAVIHSFPLETVVVMGNHDAFSFEEDEFYSILGEDCRPRPICAGNKHLLFLNACYYKTGEKYMPGGTDWTDTFLPNAHKLEAQISELEGEVYLFIHQNIDPAIRQDHRLFNGDELHAMIQNSGKICGLFQGHYHPGKQSEYNGIPYRTFPAMCENEDAVFVVEI